MTESVFVVQYTHKHGDGVNIYSTKKKAEAAADNLIKDRADSWHEEQRERLDRMSTFDDRLKYFHMVERDVSYGERINVFECVVE
jgi:hypothetical protein